MTRKARRALDSLSVELATEAELETLATLGDATQRKSARAVLLSRARELAHRAAVELTEALRRIGGAA